MIKEQLIETVRTELNRKYKEALTYVQQLQESLFLESKSSIGDKHETARSMIQIEIEQASKQLKKVEKLINTFKKIKTINRTSIGLGSLIETNHAWYYISIPLGKVLVNQQEVFCLSQTAPLSSILMQQKIGSHFYFTSKTFKIVNVY